jgi:hypothetical protein
MKTKLSALSFVVFAILSTVAVVVAYDLGYLAVPHRLGVIGVALRDVPGGQLLEMSGFIPPR